MSAFAVAIGGRADICFCTANTGDDAGCRTDASLGAVGHVQAFGNGSRGKTNVDFDRLCPDCRGW